MPCLTLEGSKVLRLKFLLEQLCTQHKLLRKILGDVGATPVFLCLCPAWNATWWAHALVSPWLHHGAPLPLRQYWAVQFLLDFKPCWDSWLNFSPGLVLGLALAVSAQGIPSMAESMHEEQNRAEKRFSKIRHSSISAACPWSCLLAQGNSRSVGTLGDTWLPLALMDGVADVSSCFDQVSEGSALGRRPGANFTSA